MSLRNSLSTEWDLRCTTGPTLDGIFILQCRWYVPRGTFLRLKSFKTAEAREAYINELLNGLHLPDLSGLE